MYLRLLGGEKYKLNRGIFYIGTPDVLFGVTVTWPTSGAEKYTKITFMFALMFPEHSFLLYPGRPKFAFISAPLFA